MNALHSTCPVTRIPRMFGVLRGSDDQLIYPPLDLASVRQGETKIEPSAKSAATVIIIRHHRTYQCWAARPSMFLFQHAYTFHSQNGKSLYDGSWPSNEFSTNVIESSLKCCPNARPSHNLYTHVQSIYKPMPPAAHPPNPSNRFAGFPAGPGIGCCACACWPWPWPWP